MKENQRIAITKKMLKDSLLEILKDKKLDDITITELCNHAQVNRTTFYRYYKIPADVLWEIEQDLAAEIHETMNAIKCEEDAKLYLKKMCEDCYDNSSILGYLLRYNTGANHTIILGDFYKRKEFFSGYERSFADYDEEQTRIVGAYFAGGAYFILRMWIAGEIKHTPAEMAEILWKLMTGDYSKLTKNL